MIVYDLVTHFSAKKKKEWAAIWVFFFLSIAHLEIAQRGKNKTRLNKQLRNVVYTTRNTSAKKKKKRNNNPCVCILAS